MALGRVFQQGRRFPAVTERGEECSSALQRASPITAVAPLLGETGVASLVKDIVDNGDGIQTGVESGLRALDRLIGLGSAVWFWLERRAPNFRLSFRKS